MVGLTGQLLGKHDINIASMSLGRSSEGGQAMMILSVDQPITQQVIKNYMRLVILIKSTVQLYQYNNIRKERR